MNTHRLSQCLPQVSRGVWRARSGLLMVLAVLLLTACSSRFLYDKLDTFVLWKVQSYVSLSRDQKQSLKSDIQTQLDQMRVDEMPRLAALLRLSARDLEAGVVTPAMLDKRYTGMLDIYDAFLLGIVPLSERFLRGLSTEQVDEFFANLEELNDEMYAEYSGRTAEEREKNRNKSALKTIKDFTGRLSDEQKLLVTDALAQMQDASEEWIDYQRLWRARFEALVKGRPPVAEYHAELVQLFVYPRNLHSEEYRERVNANRVILNEMLAELLTGLSDKQRQRAVKKLDGYADLLTELAEVA